MELFGEKKSVAQKYAVSALKYMIQVSNSNLISNADGLLAKMEADLELNGLEKVKRELMLKSIRDIRQKYYYLSVQYS